LNVELKSGLRCRGVVQLIAWLKEETDQVVTDATGFKLLLRDCPAGHDSEQVYRCLDSTGADDREQVHRSVLVSADSAGGDLLCWWFGRGDSTRFLLLSAPACYDARMAATIQPLAVFTRSLSANFTSDILTPTSMPTVSRKLFETEVKHVADVTNSSKNVHVAMHWHRAVALTFVLCLLLIHSMGVLYNVKHT